MAQGRLRGILARLVLVGLLGGCGRLAERLNKKEPATEASAPPAASAPPSRPPPVARKFRELPGPEQPARGSADAPVTIQEFANFECSFSRKAEVTLERVLQVYQGKVRIVWRHRMLPFHQRAPLASEVAIEIFQQKGPREFWLFFQKVSEVPPEVGLQLAAMESHATQIGVDMTRFRQALQARKHRIAVQEDTRLAEELGFAGTPTFLISATGRMEGYVLEGAQSFAQFKELIDRALEDARLAPRAP